MEDGWQMDGWRDSPCIQHDFDPSNSLWGHCPAYLTAAIRKYQSRARVPMTISCLWVTGFFLSGVYFYFLLSLVLAFMF